MELLLFAILIVCLLACSTGRGHTQLTGDPSTEFYWPDEIPGAPEIDISKDMGGLPPAER